MFFTFVICVKDNCMYLCSIFFYRTWIFSAHRAGTDCAEAGAGGQYRRLGHVDIPPCLHRVQPHLLGHLQTRGGRALHLLLVTWHVSPHVAPSPSPSPPVMPWSCDRIKIQNIIMSQIKLNLSIMWCCFVWLWKSTCKSSCLDTSIMNMNLYMMLHPTSKWFAQ